MKSIFTGLMGFLALSGVALAKGDAAKDEAAIKATCAAFDAAWAKGDGKAVAAVFTEDATLVNAMGQTSDGRAAIEKQMTTDFGGMLKGTTHAITMTSIKFVKPEVAVGDADLVMTGAKGPDGKAMPPMKLKGTGVFVKQKGAWLFAAARGYALVPPPPAPPVAPAAPAAKPAK